MYEYSAAHVRDLEIQQLRDVVSAVLHSAGNMPAASYDARVLISLAYPSNSSSYFRNNTPRKGRLKAYQQRGYGVKLSTGLTSSCLAVIPGQLFVTQMCSDITK